VCFLHTTVLIALVCVSMRIIRALDTNLFILASAVYIFVFMNDKLLFLFSKTYMGEVT
jgi:hypothetical protein